MDDVSVDFLIERTKTRILELNLALSNLNKKDREFFLKRNRLKDSLSQNEKLITDLCSIKSIPVPENHVQ